MKQFTGPAVPWCDPGAMEKLKMKRTTAMSLAVLILGTLGIASAETIPVPIPEKSSWRFVGIPKLVFLSAAFTTFLISSYSAE